MKNLTLKHNLLDKAIVFAAKKHTGQLKKGTEVPYIVHLI
jgi:(p)ppGpp synthase/HD superfamily hydrolase